MENVEEEVLGSEAQGLPSLGIWDEYLKFGVAVLLICDWILFVIGDLSFKISEFVHRLVGQRRRRL